MVFIAVLVVFLLVQWWGSGAPLQKDHWYQQWCARLAHSEYLSKRAGAVLTAAIAGPTLALLVAYWLVTAIWPWFGLLIAVPVLLYALGRGEFVTPVNRYLDAWHEDDWETAQAVCQQMQALGTGESSTANQGDWHTLHQTMLKTLSYNGFERLFAVVFWFVLLGPGGALVYRLSRLYQLYGDPEIDQHHARRLIWLLEWPAARLLGLSFALTGNFVGCFAQWRETLLDRESATDEIVFEQMQGALGVDEDEPQPDVITHREFKAALSLYSRTWVFWMCLLAVGTVLL